MSDPISDLENLFNDREVEIDIKIEGGPLFWEEYNKLMKEEASKFVTL